MEETIVLAGGCFWCTEAVLKRLKGISSVTSGYVNSKIANPTYDQVSNEETGAAEGIEVAFDSKVISLGTVLDVFFATHDPTTLNQQGNDVGTQYRSGIYYSTDEQKKLAEEKKRKINGAVTEIKKLENFTSAEEYHQNFYDRNRNYPYCRLIIDPKINKLLKEYKDEVKEEVKNNG